MVVGDDGKVCCAHSYQGNLEEGLARYEAEVGPQLLGEPRPLREVDDDPPHVPDFAHWKPSGAETTANGKRAKRQDDAIDLSWAYEDAAARTAEQAAQAASGRADGGATGPQRTETAEKTPKAGDGRMSQGVEPGPGFADVAEGAETTSVVPLVLIESEERAKTQNEIRDARHEAEDTGDRAIEENFGQADGGGQRPAPNGRFRAVTGSLAVEGPRGRLIESRSR